ncbi:unnamed protein product [Notodromas monacha]|uniref:MYND-type domain-containing protein n=1 Tax=Notodromas monacha TaxID=399045 RepID=A0A7R9BNS4_9CRUS|nr:unnamed protein product [Notodromas monacha]CAG0917537.1 unnamed protein product [Notodromas monacha]
METDQPGKTSPLAQYLRLLNSIHDVNKLSFSKRPLEDQLDFLFHSEKVRDYRPKMYSETKNVFRAYECSSKAKNCHKISTKFARLKDALRFAPRFGDMFADIVMFRASLTSKMLHRPDEALRQIAELGSGFGKQKSAEIRKLEQDLRETLKQGSFKTTDHNSKQHHWLDLTKEERISPFCSVSDKIKLGKTGKKGFGYFAEVDLKPGEVLISETALSSVLMPDTWATHCNMCHNQVYVGFPCPKCPHVIYCDKECYQRSQTFHKFECKAMVNLRELCLLHPTALVALKMVLSTNLRDLVGTKGRRLSRKPQDQDYLQKYHPGDWRSTFNLQQSQANEDSELVLSNAKLAVYLVKLLEEMGYFAAQDYPASTEEKICLSELLSHWLSTFASNCFPISTPQVKKAEDEVKVWLSPTGTGIFPSSAMFNHACYPNATAASLTSKMLHRPDEALRQIAELGSGFGKQKSAEVRKLEQDLRETLKQGSFKTTDHNSNQYHWLDLTKEERISPFCSVSDKIKLGKTGKKGFGYFAEVDLKPGEVLISETALSSVLMPDTWATHCNMCHNQVYVGFPCPKCPHVIYCDKECYQRSQTFHKFECKAMVNLRELCLLHPTALVALKMVLSTNLRDLVGTKGRRLSRKPQDQDYLQKYHPGDWRSTFNLQQSQANEDSELVLSNAKLAVYLVKLLEEMGYFAAQDYPASTEEKICLSELLSHWLSTFASNCFPISTPQVKKAEDEVKVWLSATGTGIFPSSAMFNHACYPNATAYFLNNKLKRKSLMSVCEQCGPYQAHSDRILQLADVDQMFKNATAWVLDTEQTVTNYKSPKCVKPHQCAFRAQNLLIKCFLVDAVLAKPVLIASRHEIPDIDQNHQVLPQQVKSRTQPKFLRIVDSLGTS